ncbi:secretion system protein [Pseudonocardia sp. TMWB2A]|uniref:type II and III secretion system protein family protein n=1 Tax=Pseudonocardia sp. TMWB2A TaxID=687430 RepID=UPI00307E435D
MNRTSSKKLLLAGALAALAGMGSSMSLSTAAIAAPRSNASADLALSVGRGRLITLPRPMTDVFVANDKVADVQVRSATQLYVFAKTPGETSVYATDAAGKVVYSSVVRVANNLETLDQMLGLAMPNADITINSMNGFVLLTGTVASPEDAAEADRLVQAMVGENTKVISRLQTATPLQVNLQVRVAEVSKTILKEVGMNLLTNDNNGGGFFGEVISGNDSAFRTNADGVVQSYRKKADGTTFAFGKNILGNAVMATLDLAERDGLVATLAQPNLTTVSGETADFLAGGEYPIPVASSQNDSIAIEYRKFGVSLSYTPTVLSNGRISMRVRPEVSELSTEGAIKINGFEVPALTVRRTETTVELGSGESFMIAGLMSNKSIGAINKAPGLGDVPILGNLFKSDSFRRGETELVIMITPYLVKPVSSAQIKLPTDAYNSPNDVQRILFNQGSDGVTNGTRPMPRVENNTNVGAPVTPGITQALPPQRRKKDNTATVGATPGFSGN